MVGLGLDKKIGLLYRGYKKSLINALPNSNLLRGFNIYKFEKKGMRGKSRYLFDLHKIHVINVFVVRYRKLHVLA